MYEFSVINSLIGAGLLLPLGAGVTFLWYELFKFWLEEADLSSDWLLKVTGIIFATALLRFVAGTFRACGSIDWSTPCCRKNQSASGG